MAKGKMEIRVSVGKPGSFEGSPKGLFSRPGYGSPVEPSRMKSPFRATVEKIDGGWLVSHPESCYEMFPERRHATTTLDDAVSYIREVSEGFDKKSEKHEEEEGEHASEE